MCKPVAKTLFNQWQAMLESGRIPVLEYELLNGDYLLVHIDLHLAKGKGGFRFSFDSNDLPMWFSGNVKKLGYKFVLPFDKYCDDLDTYLQQVDQEITEGFLIPNNLI